MPELVPLEDVPVEDDEGRVFEVRELLLPQPAAKAAEDTVVTATRVRSARIFFMAVSPIGCLGSCVRRVSLQPLGQRETGFNRLISRRNHLSTGVRGSPPDVQCPGPWDVA